MHANSGTIGAIAGALAKAQSQLTNPEKSLIAMVPARDNSKTFRYASLASGLDIVRKCLGEHEIATIQTTTIDHAQGQIVLTTMLAHASGEWLSSTWPVCAISEVGSPHKMGSALTYARRYALFAFVGIAGEDDVDAPPHLPSPLAETFSLKTLPKATSKTLSQSVLGSQPSAELRKRLISDIIASKDSESLALWAYRHLSAKNALSQADAAAVEAAYQEALTTNATRTKPASAPTVTLEKVDDTRADPCPHDQLFNSPPNPPGTQKKTPIAKLDRRRSKRHLTYVASQPCLVCERSPCDAHHLKYTQPKALGRKVSDEFTVPLCRDHHQSLHHSGNELVWWADKMLSPTYVARTLWANSPAHGSGIHLDPFADVPADESTTPH